MKILTLTVAIAFALPTPTFGLAQATDHQGEPHTPEQELKALDLSWHQAVAARDAETLGRLLADDYQFELDARRMLTKAQEVEAVQAQDLPFDFGAFKLSDVGVTAGEKGATVSGILTTRPSGGDGKARPRYFYTRTLVGRDGRWQIISSRLVSLAAEGG